MEQSNSLYLVFENYKTDLQSYMDDKESKSPMDKGTVRNFMRDIMRGVQHIHTVGVIHRAIKPKNFVIDEHGTVKLAEFGLAQLSSGLSVRSFTQEIANIWYSAPEILLGDTEFKTFGDIWPIGCICSEMASDIVLFKGDSERDQLLKIFEMMHTPTENIWPGSTQLPEFKKYNFPTLNNYGLKAYLSVFFEDNDIGFDLLEKMLTYHPTRISATAALEHQYFL